MQESIETIHAELEERLRFETLLAELSAHFVNLPADRMDSEIEDAQRRICEFLDLDRSALFQVPEREPGVLLLTHIHRVPVPWIFDGNGIQPHRCPAADVSRQDADDARKHDVARDDRRRRLTRNQHSR